MKLQSSSLSGTYPLSKISLFTRAAYRAKRRALFIKSSANVVVGFVTNSTACSPVLRTIGFDVFMLAAESNREGGYGPEFDHMATVNLDELVSRCGFRDSFVNPSCSMRTVFSSRNSSLSNYYDDSFGCDRRETDQIETSVSFHTEPITMLT
jgi:hypothetical protein